MSSNKEYVRGMIINALKHLIIENNQEVTISELADYIGIAKGTIYKYFSSKNHVYLELLISNEKDLLELTIFNKKNILCSLNEYMLYHMENANRTIIYHSIEEKIANNEKKLNDLFIELYSLREQRIKFLKPSVENFLIERKSNFSARDYLSYVWGLTYGAALLLTSTYYQKNIGDRVNLMKLYIEQAIVV